MKPPSDGARMGSVCHAGKVEHPARAYPRNSAHSRVGRPRRSEEGDHALVEKLIPSR